jgi:preprotein translocase subunit SecD
MGAAFGCGMVLQSYLYQDACLDMGGGQKPGNHPICVVVSQPDWITIGPVTLKSDQVQKVSVAEASDGTSAVALEISASAAGALRGLTATAVGQPVNVSVGDTVVSAVTVHETIANRNLVIIMSDEAASRLAEVY